MALSKGQIAGIATGVAVPVVLFAALHAAAGMDEGTINAEKWAYVRTKFAYFVHNHGGQELNRRSDFSAVSQYLKDWGWKKGTLTATKKMVEKVDGDSKKQVEEWNWAYEAKKPKAVEPKGEPKEETKGKEDENVLTGLDAVDKFMEVWNKEHSSTVATSDNRSDS